MLIENSIFYKNSDLNPSGHVQFVRIHPPHTNEKKRKREKEKLYRF